MRTELSDETREWMQVMQGLRVTSVSVSYEDLCAIGLSGMVQALDELDAAGLTRTWGGSAGVYIDVLWL